MSDRTLYQPVSVFDILAGSALIALTARARASRPGYVPPFNDAKWLPLETPSALASDFSEIRVTIDRRLSDAEVQQAAGALGYALKQVLCGEELSEPYALRSFRAQTTTLLFAFDSTKSCRSEPAPELAFQLAETYIAQGTPVRKTNHAGFGTQGTRLVEGIGPCALQFAVR